MHTRSRIHAIHIIQVGAYHTFIHTSTLAPDVCSRVRLTYTYLCAILYVFSNAYFLLRQQTTLHLPVRRATPAKNVFVLSGDHHPTNIYVYSAAVRLSRVYSDFQIVSWTDRLCKHHIYFILFLFFVLLSLCLEQYTHEPQQFILVYTARIHCCNVFIGIILCVQRVFLCLQ